MSSLACLQMNKTVLAEARAQLSVRGIKGGAPLGAEGEVPPLTGMPVSETSVPGPFFRGTVRAAAASACRLGSAFVPIAR